MIKNQSHFRNLELMKIKKFYFTKGSYDVYTHKLEYIDGRFHYSTWPEMENGGLYLDMPMSFRITTGVEIVEEEVISFIDPSSGALEIEQEKLDRFLKYVER